MKVDMIPEILVRKRQNGRGLNVSLSRCFNLIDNPVAVIHLSQPL
jgi:hypothetical protein